MNKLFLELSLSSGLLTPTKNTRRLLPLLVPLLAISPASMEFNTVWTFYLKLYLFNTVFVFLFFFWPCSKACGILVPQLGIKSMWSPNHWTAREFPVI